MMEIKNKKIIIVLAIVGFFIIGVWLYFIFSRNNQINKNQSERIFKKNLIKIQSVINNDLYESEDDYHKIINSVLSEDEQFLYYYNDQIKPGLFTLRLKDSQIEQINDNLDSVSNIIWSPDLSKAILLVTNDNKKFLENNSPFKINRVPDGYTTNWLYDLKTKKLTNLSYFMKNLAWSPDSQKIAYQYVDTEKGINQISVADPDGLNWQNIIALTKEVSTIKFTPDGKKLILLIQDVDDFSSVSSISVLDLVNKQISKIPNTEGTVSVVIEKNSQKIVFNKLDDQGLSNLWVTDQSGIQKNLNINISTEKINWFDSQHIIAAQLQGETQSDKFLKINIETGEKKEIPYDDGGIVIHAQNLMSTKDGKTLYFTSDDYLYRLEGL